MLSTSDIFCIFLHLFRAVLVRNSATSSSDSRERHFLVHSWITASRPRIENEVDLWSISIVYNEMYTIESMVCCSYLPNTVSTIWPLSQSEKGAYIWMNNKLRGCSSKSVLSSSSLLKVTLWDIFFQENLSEYLKIMVLDIAEHGNYSSELKMFDPFSKPTWLVENGISLGV